MILGFTSSIFKSPLLSSLDNTNISFINLLNLSASLLIISKNLSQVSLSSTNFNVSENPLIEVKGVFNSCDTLATN